jgi:Spy/CpxP family protein refolding chaperone
MKKIVLISLTLIMTVTMLMAQKADRAMKHDHGKMQMQQGGMNPMAACMEELKLTDAQRMKFHEARAAFQKQENTLTAEIKNLRLDIAEAMKAENIKRVKELNQQISAKELQLKNARVDMMAAHMRELTKEQKEIMKKHLPMMMGGMHHGGQPQMRSARGQRRAPGMGQRMQDCDDCGDDCDGERKFKNRK